MDFLGEGRSQEADSWFFCFGFCFVFFYTCGWLYCINKSIP